MDGTTLDEGQRTSTNGMINGRPKTAEEAHVPILWGVGTSRTIRPHWAFHELDLDFDCRAISPRSGETQTAEFTALTARQKIPLLQDGDLVLTESAAIIWYLSETYGRDHNRLVPTGPRDRARCLEWCFFILGELDETSLYVMRRHSDMRQVYGEAPAAIEGATTYFRKQMRTVERALEAGPRFILGERFTAADILLSTCVTWAVRYGIPMADSVIAYNARATARPSYARAEQTNGPL